MICGLILASSFASAGLVMYICCLPLANDSSIVRLFYRINVRSNETTTVFYTGGTTLSRMVEQVFDVARQTR